MSDLIERLKMARRVVSGDKGRATITEAITALSPVLPDDVAELVNRLQEPYEQNQSRRVAEERQAADLLERQARDIAAYERYEKTMGKVVPELQQRIEELESALTTLGEKGFMSFEDRAAFARAALQESNDETR